jgi:hypothetical protein
LGQRWCTVSGGGFPVKGAQVLFCCHGEWARVSEWFVVLWWGWFDEWWCEEECHGLKKTRWWWCRMIKGRWKQLEWSDGVGRWRRWSGIQSWKARERTNL